MTHPMVKAEDKCPSFCNILNFLDLIYPKDTMILSLKVKSDLKPPKMANYIQRLQLKEVWILIKSV